jgi:hypothetical protein
MRKIQKMEDSFRLINIAGFLLSTNVSPPKSRFRNCHCEGTEAISSFLMRLPRTLQVLAMTEWDKGFGS